MKIKKNNIIKASIVLMISIILIGSSVTVFANIRKGRSVSLQSDYYIMAENTSAWPGDAPHLFRINGSWAEEIMMYSISFSLPTDTIEDVVEVNLTGCAGENPYSFFWEYNNVTGFGRGFCYYTQVPVPGYGIPAGSGILFNVVVTILDTASPGNHLIDLTNDYAWFTLMDYSEVTPELIDGYLAILNNAPEIPTLTGDAEGEVGDDLTFSAVSTDLDGHHIKYGFDWDDGNPIEWTNLEESGIPVEVTHSWDEPGTYEVRVMAEDQYGAQSDWSDILEVTIIESGVPELEIESITGGMGLTVSVKNDGNANATDVFLNGTIEGGFIINPSEFSESIGILDPDESAEVTVSVFGIGLGVLTDIPTITVNATCTEGSTANATGTAKIFLFFVIIEA